MKTFFRVIEPPGGRGTDIFGRDWDAAPEQAHEVQQAEAQHKGAHDMRNKSNVFDETRTNDLTKPSIGFKVMAPPGGVTHNIFGVGEDEEEKEKEKPKEADRSVGVAVRQPAPEPEPAATIAARTPPQARAQTRDMFGSGAENAAKPSIKLRQPPGGVSHNIFG